VNAEYLVAGGNVYDIEMSHFKLEIDDGGATWEKRILLPAGSKLGGNSYKRANTNDKTG
jgi:hypothetical protein